MPYCHYSTCALRHNPGNVSIGGFLFVHYYYGNRKPVRGSNLKALRTRVTYKGQRDHAHSPSEKGDN